MPKVLRKTVGLALGSGGWRGLAHIGVIKVFQREGLPIDFIAGSSAGALIGGLYSYFGSTGEIEEIVKKLNYRSLYGILFDPARKLGLIGGKKYVEFIEKYTGDVRIEDLKVKFTAVCSDLIQGSAVGIARGKLSEAIRASSSIPVIFRPELINGRMLVDGGNSMPIPTKIVKDMGADIVIGVNLYNNIFPFDIDEVKRQKLTSMGVTRICYQMILENLAREDLRDADIIINPKITEGRFNIFKNFIERQEATIKDGEKAAEKIIPKLKKLL